MLSQRTTHLVQSAPSRTGRSSASVGVVPSPRRTVLPSGGPVRSEVLLLHGQADDRLDRGAGSMLAMLAAARGDRGRSTPGPTGRGAAPGLAGRSGHGPVALPQGHLATRQPVQDRQVLATVRVLGRPSWKTQLGNGEVLVGVVQRRRRDSHNQLGNGQVLVGVVQRRRRDSLPHVQPLRHGVSVPWANERTNGGHCPQGLGCHEGMQRKSTAVSNLGHGLVRTEPRP